MVGAVAAGHLDRHLAAEGTLAGEQDLAHGPLGDGAEIDDFGVALADQHRQGPPDRAIAAAGRAQRPFVVDPQLLRLDVVADKGGGELVGVQARSRNTVEGDSGGTAAGGGTLGHVHPRGRCMMKRQPAPGMDSTTTPPLWSSAMRLTRASPNPVPPSLPKDAKL